MQHEIQNTSKEMNKSTSISRKKDIRTIIIAVLVLIIIFLVGLGVIVGKRQGILFSKDNTQVTEAQAGRIVRKLSDIILIPSEEIPLVFKITNVEEIKATQPFYIHAENGHYLIVYQQSALAFIYDKGNDRVINVGPVAIPQNAQPSLSQNPRTVSVEIRNGGASEQRMNELKSILTQNPLFDVATQTTSQNRYQNFLVVNLGGAPSKEHAKALSDFLNAELTTLLPNTEPVSESDILVILGEKN
jgi:hypothetical protein